MILAIKTDQDPVEIHILNGSGKVLGQKKWSAGYELSKTLLKEIVKLLQKKQSEISDIEGVIVYQGPGGFTSLRLGVLTANTIAYSNNVPVAGATGSNWMKSGLEKLKSARAGQYIVPEYGRQPNITKQKK